MNDRQHASAITDETSRASCRIIHDVQKSLTVEEHVAETGDFVEGAGKRIEGNLTRWLWSGS